jgi:hypothetical protein
MGSDWRFDVFGVYLRIASATESASYSVALLKKSARPTSRDNAPKALMFEAGAAVHPR